MALAQRQLGGILDRHHPLVAGDEAREHVEERRLAGAGATRHQDVQPRADRTFEELQHRRSHRFAFDEIGGAEPVGAETADRHRRPVERERRDDHVDARAVLQSGVDHRARLVDAPPDGADDPFDDLHQVLVVAEDDLGLFDPSFAFDVDQVGAIDQDVGNRRVPQQQLEGPETEELVEHLRGHVLPLEQAQRQRRAFPIEDPGDDAANLRLGVRARDLGEPIEVELVEQILVNAPLQRLVAGAVAVALCESFESWNRNRRTHDRLLLTPAAAPAVRKRRCSARRAGASGFRPNRWPSPETRRRAGSGRAPPDGRRSSRRRRRDSRWGCSA